VPELVVQLGSEVDGLTLHQIPEQETKKVSPMKTKFRREQFYSRPNHSEGPAATWDLWRSTKEEEDAKKQFRKKKVSY
jgi:hypothetical protein